MPKPAFRKADITRACQAVRSATDEPFDLSFDDRGFPVIRVRPASLTAGDDYAAEIESWSRGQTQG